MLRKSALCVFVLCLTASAVYAQPAGKVIFDSDMAYLNDDALAMFMLAQADKAGSLQLLGITTVGGNVFVPEATTAALRQLELIGRTDVKVYQGVDVPLAGFRNMKEEARLYGVPFYCGAYWDFGTNTFADIDRRSPDYLHLSKEPLYGYPQTRAEKLSAIDFMIEQVKKYPDEVTIMAIGSATNIALALKKYPELAEHAAGIIYMGGDIDRPGQATSAAEFNFYYDPDAIKLCLAADWKKQLVVPDDLAHQVIMTSEFYERLAAKKPNPITKLILSGNRTFYDETAKYVWDMLVPAVYLKPEIITDLQTRYITVDERPGINSGRAVTWSQHRFNDMKTGRGFPEGVKKAQIVMGIDDKAFWDLCVDVLSAE